VPRRAYEDLASWLRFGRRFIPQHEPKRLFGERERIFKDAKRAHCRVGVPIAGNEAIDQGTLLCHARFEFSDMPPSGGFHGPVHFYHPKTLTHGVD
jgi:hypothetical protein